MSLTRVYWIFLKLFFRGNYCKAKKLNNLSFFKINNATFSRRTKIIR